MPVKHFVVDPDKKSVDRAELAKSKLDEQLLHRKVSEERKRLNEAAMSHGETLQFIPGRVVVSVDIEAKNSHRFEDGTTIRRERKYNEFNMRIAQPVNAVVVSAEYIPVGSEILISHNSIHDTNKIFDYQKLSGAAEASDIRYYSLPEDDCFAWRDTDGEMKPLKGYQFGLRVYEPYKGYLMGIEPTLIQDTLYVLTGKLKGLVVGTVKAADYQIVFQENTTGQEGNLIRFRHSDDEELEREEVVYIHHDLTERLSRGDIMVGLTPTTAKTIVNAN